MVASDFVSGNLAKNHGTPSGSFGVTYKAKDAVLRGEDYESPVSLSLIHIFGSQRIYHGKYRDTVSSSGYAGV